MGGRQGTSWTGRQSIAGQHRDIQPCTHSFTPKGNLERPIDLTVMFLDCGRKTEYLVRTHACTERTCKLQAKDHPPGVEPKNFFTVKQQCYQLRHHATHDILII
ncbi:hypothetical protein ATANTOWER_023713 [Ataeniobius toweri]|uniref:Uncharacterized protein n=1 Tax=Ataeniobius toweri TaxID=208326 RepID=A0ABU7CFP4_9TELE|nr:hypothetical protein [Ataeniobius toweri]